MFYKQLTLAAIILSGASLVTANVGNAGDKNGIDPLAQNLLSQGISYCRQADKYSRSDLDRAEEAYSQFQKHRKRAEEIDQRVLEITPKIVNQLAHCDRVNANLQRAKALPVIEKGIESCFAAKSELSSKHLSKAKAAFADYVDRREAAIMMAPTILKLGGVSRDIKQCDRLGTKISKAESEGTRWSQQLAQMTGHLWKAVNTCEIASGNASLSSPDLIGVHTKLEQAADFRYKAVSYTGIMQYVKENPETKASEDIKDLLVKYDQCEELVLSAVQVHEMNAPIDNGETAIAHLDELPSDVPADDIIDTSSGVQSATVNLAQN